MNFKAIYSNNITTLTSIGTIPAEFAPSRDLHVDTLMQDGSQARGLGALSITKNGNVSIVPDNRYSAWRWCITNGVYPLDY